MTGHWTAAALRGMRALAIVAALAASGPAVAQQQTGAGDDTLGTDELRDLLGESPQGALGPREARGLVEPRAEAVLSSEIAGRIERLPFDEGDAFAKGDVLVGFDCASYRADLAVAQAELRGARHKLENARKLARLNSIGTLDVALAETAVDKAAATVRLKKLTVARCRLRAPYAGRVVAHAVNRYESVARDQELLSVIATGAPEIRLIVPSRWLAWLSPGDRFTLRIDETGASHRGTVETIGARIDPVSQTVPVIGRLSGDIAGLVPGMSGTARFEPGES